MTQLGGVSRDQNPGLSILAQSCPLTTTVPPSPSALGISSHISDRTDKCVPIGVVIL